MTRGYSLEQDLGLLMNNPKYSDIEILCEDEKKLHGCRAILAARSEVFDSLLYNGMKETYENQIIFPEINSSGMEIVLEYIYTGSIKEGTLNKDNIVESFYAADFFQLPDLQDIVMKTVEDNPEKEYYSPELLSKVAETMPLTEDNILLNLLVRKVATMPLNTIEFSRLSIEGLGYLLSCTLEKEEPFVTPEYEVFRYSAILAAKQVSDDEFKILAERLPTLEQLENSVQIENKFIPDHQKVAKELESLVKFIDFRRINSQILNDIIKPLEIIPIEIISTIYRYDLNEIRGTLDFWDKSACGSKLIIKDNGKVVQASNDCYSHQSVRVKMILDNKGIFEWDVIIENYCNLAWIGVCASENFDYDTWAGDHFNGWILGSNGIGYNCGKSSQHYCPSFGDGTKITVHLDMNKGTIAFTVNGTKYPNVSVWDNLPSKLYPVVSLRHPGRFRIQNYRKVQLIKFS